MQQGLGGKAGVATCGAFGFPFHSLLRGCRKFGVPGAPWILLLWTFASTGVWRSSPFRIRLPTPSPHGVSVRMCWDPTTGAHKVALVH